MTAKPDSPHTSDPGKGDAPPAPPVHSPATEPRPPRRANHRRPRLRVPTLRKTPGTQPGIEHSEIAAVVPPPRTRPVRVTCIDYAPDQVQTQDVTDIDQFLALHRPAWTAVRWINVDGLSDLRVIEALARKYNLHPLALEDMLHIPQRPKFDAFAASGQYQPRLFISVRMIESIEGHLRGEQISMFLGKSTVLTFQEDPGDVWDPIRQRIHKAGSRLRGNDASFLVYSLLDAIVDHCFPLLEQYGDRLDELEERLLQRPRPEIMHQVHALKRELLLLRREIWPLRELVHGLQVEAHECLSDEARTYLRDVYDHAVQIIDLLETYREISGTLAETYMTAMSVRMNEIMKVLTIIGTIFLPLTFLAGVWGMNFQGMYETHSRWATPWFYPIGFWSLCLAVAVGMFIWFKRRGWW